MPEHGDYVRPRPQGNAHIVMTVSPYNKRHARVEFACGQAWSTEVCIPAPEDPDRPCHACWEAM